MGRIRDRAGGLYSLSLACVVMASVLLAGCSRFQARSTFREADDLFAAGNYGASLSAYEQVMKSLPGEGDRALYEMGIIHAYPRNELKDYRQALECFQRVVEDYPGSPFRHESERMIFHINNVLLKDRKISAQQAQIDALRREAESRGKHVEALEKEAAALEKKIEALEQKIRSLDKGPADRVLIEKKERRMTLLSKGRVIRTYRVALGGNPDGPKVRKGDSKTPEGTYFIDSRNRDSRYHLSLHISYPNEQDRRRARRLGVSPGGDIMIHGIKNGFSEVGELHTGADWTRGCIAVTDEEIEEIERLVPNGTVVEIRP